MSAARRLLIPVAVTLCGLAVLLGLGTWQLERKGWKEGLIATLNERTAAAPVALPPPEQWGRLTADNSEFMRVRLRADFRSDFRMIVDDEPDVGGRSDWQKFFCERADFIGRGIFGAQLNQVRAAFAELPTNFGRIASVQIGSVNEGVEAAITQGRKAVHQTTFR